MTLIPINLKNKISFHSYDSDFYRVIDVPFSEKRIEFVNELSKKILKSKEYRHMADLITFGYWCRKANLNRIRKNYDDINDRVGLGVVLHITPNNVPVNFAFSFIFSFLSGNSNMVRIPSRNFEQVEAFISIFNEVVSSNKFKEFRKSNYFLSFDRDAEVMEYLSKISDSRIIWGSDLTVEELKQVPTKERCIDVYFSERRSGSIIKAKEIINLNERDLLKLSKNIFNDIFLMDQNACSSPHYFFWLGSKKNISLAKKVLWKSIGALATKNYDLQPSQLFSKFTKACSDVIEIEDLNSISIDSGVLYRLDIDLKNFTTSLVSNGSGYIYEFSIKILEDLSSRIDKRFQTLTYFGFSKIELRKFIFGSLPEGVDRIVPFGQALDMSEKWDGFDLPRKLSRFVEIR